MENTPFISIIVPVYNGEKFLGACINSLKQQCYTDYEIIIVDDGSTDNSPKLVTPPARLISTLGRTGAGAARNLGAKSANGSFLLFTDADVEVPKDWVKNTAQTIIKKKVKCGGGGYAGPVKNTFIQWFAFEELAWRRRNFHGEVETLVSNNLFCERELFYALGGFPETYCAASSEDMEFSWKVSRNHKLWWDKDNGVFHNFTPTIKDYLRQQYRFARDAIPMIFNNKGLIGAKTHHPKSFYLEIMLTGLLVLFLIFLLPIAAFISALTVLWINHGLLTAMGNKHQKGFVLKSVSLIFMRDIVIILGALHGIMRKS